MDKISMRREIGKDYATYDDYIEHQKEKTTDPVRRQKWLNAEWNMKITIFEKVFKHYKDKKLLSENMKALCFGARTGQEVVALNNLKIDAIGIDLVPQEPYVIQGDIHKAPFKNNTFDFIFTNIMDHSIYPNKFVSEMERVLKPNGYCLVQLQLTHKADAYAENNIYNSNAVIELFKSSKLILDRDIPKTLAMNREFLMQKNV